MAKLCGLSILERNLRLLGALGIEEVTLLLGPRGQGIKDSLKSPDLKIRYLSQGEGLGGLSIKGPFLLLRGDHLFDERIVRALLQRKETTLAVDTRAEGENGRDMPKVVLGEGRVSAIGRDLEEWDGLYIGASLCAPEVAPLLCRHGEEPFLEPIVEEGCSYLDIRQIPTYMPEMRRDLPIFWWRIEGREDLKRAKEAVIERTQKGTLDIFAWYLHRPIENRITYHLSDLPITPNQVTVFTNLVAYFITFLFLRGSLLVGCLLIPLVNVLDGVDGKLARAREITTKLGHIEHSFDLLFEQSWYIAYAWHAFTQWGSILPLVLGIFMLLLDSFNRHCSMQFKQVTGVSLADYARFDRLFRKFDGRRNIYTLYMLAGAIFRWPLYALVAMASHALLTAVVYATRAVKHLREEDRKTGR